MFILDLWRFVSYVLLDSKYRKTHPSSHSYNSPDEPIGGACTNSVPYWMSLSPSDDASQGKRETSHVAMHPSIRLIYPRIRLIRSKFPSAAGPIKCEIGSECDRLKYARVCVAVGGPDALIVTSWCRQKQLRKQLNADRIRIRCDNGLFEGDDWGFERWNGKREGDEGNAYWFDV